jgi:Flp pilus assembly protein TadD
MEKKNWDEALDDLGAAEKLIPEVDRAALEGALDVNRFKILLGKKEYPAAYALAANLSTGHPEDSGLQNELAWQIVSDKTIEKPDLGLAEMLAHRANKAAKGKDPDILDTLARVLFMKGQKKEAVETEARAVALSGPDDKQSLQSTLDSYKRGELPAVDASD